MSERLCSLRQIVSYFDLYLNLINSFCLEESKWIFELSSLQ